MERKNFYYMSAFLIKKPIIFFLFILFLCFSCQQPSEKIVTDYKTETKEVTEIIYQRELIQMITVPLISNFDMGFIGVSGATPVHIVPSISSFKIGKYEVTYDEWYTVRTWALANGYSFANLGRLADDESTGGVPTGSTKNKPVTMINWRDSIVWCNAASEYDGLTPVYYTDSGFTTLLKTSTNTSGVNTIAGSEDNPYVNWSANGYRLPTEAEWESAARYQDGTNWTPGNYASGSTANCYDPAATDKVAWYRTNSGDESHDVALKNPNQLNLYDMSGNVGEWCWDWISAYTTTSPYTDINPKGPISGLCRIIRGGGWNNDSDDIRISWRFHINPDFIDSFVGLRLARSY